MVGSDTFPADAPQRTFHWFHEAVCLPPIPCRGRVCDWCAAKNVAPRRCPLPPSARAVRIRSASATREATRCRWRIVPSATRTTRAVGGGASGAGPSRRRSPSPRGKRGRGSRRRSSCLGWGFGSIASMRCRALRPRPPRRLRFRRRQSPNRLPRPFHPSFPPWRAQRRRPTPGARLRLTRFPGRGGETSRCRYG